MNTVVSCPGPGPVETVSNGFKWFGRTGGRGGGRAGRAVGRSDGRRAGGF